MAKLLHTMLGDTLLHRAGQSWEQAVRSIPVSDKKAGTHNSPPCSEQKQISSPLIYALKVYCVSRSL